MKFPNATSALTRAGTVLGGGLVYSLAPLAAGLALGALAMTVIEPAPRHIARAVHPAAIEPAAGITADSAPAIRLAAIPSPILGPRPIMAPPMVSPPSPEPSPAKVPAWRVHAVAAPPVAGRPMIAIIIDDMGLDRRRSLGAASLPAPLTLAYMPEASDLARQTRAARDRGHELLVHVSMEGTVPSGANTLRPGHSAEELRRRLDWSLGRFDGFVGVNNHMGSRFTSEPKGLGIVLGALERRGLLFVDSRTTPDSAARFAARATGVAFTSRDVFLDHEKGRQAVAARLAELERIARRRGYAVAIGHPRRITIDALRAWIPEAGRRGFVLVPISAIVGRELVLGLRRKPKTRAPLGG